MNRSRKLSRTFALIGVPSSIGARRTGLELGPRRLREAGLLDRLRAAGHHVVDMGDLAEAIYSPDTRSPAAQNIDKVIGVIRRVVTAVDVAISSGSVPLVIGGDCTITLGVLASLTKHFPNVGLMYLDGDIDLNTPETSPSGILDGMGIAHILGNGARALSHVGVRYPLLSPAQVTLFGYSDQAGSIDPPELELLRKYSDIATFPLQAIAGDVPASAARALRELESKVDRIVVHFDVDVVDSAEFDAADVAHSPGLTMAETQSALDVFVGGARTAAVVVTEFNPRYNKAEILARQLVHMIVTAAEREAVSSGV